MINKFKLIKFKRPNEWLQARLSCITATSASSVLGLNKWETALEVYIRLLTGKGKVVEESEAMALGRKYEPIARQMFSIKHNEYERVDPPVNNWLITQRRKKWFGATPDGLLKQDDKFIGGLECKYHLIRGKDDEEAWKSGVLPQQYYIQVLHTINASERQFQVYYLVALLEHEKRNEKGEWVFDNIEYREYKFVTSELRQDLDYEEKAMYNFMNEHVTKRKFPTITL